ncbi:MAG: CoA transferase [Chloroflexi bacterium]|nr:CoA transferase [Chloroflexota bacterium]
MDASLTGIRVADFSWIAAGPYCTELMGFLGAEVVRFESATRIDNYRRGILTGDPHPDRQPQFNEMNLNKMSVRLDLGQPGALDLAKTTVAISDFVVENFRPGVMERLGLGYEALRLARPDIIMVSLSSCGATGPERFSAGIANTFSALGGLGHMTGYPNGPPTMMLRSVDHRAGATACFAALAALHHRQRTGEGQYIDLSAWEVVTCGIGEAVLEAAVTGVAPLRHANQDRIMAPHDCYPCRGEDGWVAIAVGDDEEWKGLRKALDEPPWMEDPRFADGYLRWKNREALDGFIAAWTRERTPAEAMRALQAHGVAAVPSCDARSLYEDPHVRARGVFGEVTHPEMGKRAVVGPPWKFSATTARVQRPAPLLGQHTAHVIGELLGLGQARVQELVKERVLN